MSTKSESWPRSGSIEKNETRLCCCEFIDFSGKKRHLMAACCDCEAVDDAFERFLSGSKVPPENYKLVQIMVLDRLRIPFCNGRGAVRLSADVVLPIAMIPSMVLLGSIGPVWTGVSFVLFPLFAYYVSAKFVARNPRSPVFLVWALCTSAFLLAVMELEVIPYMEIYLWENLLLKCFVVALFACVYGMRKTHEAVEPKSSNSQQFLEDPEMMKKCPVCNTVQSPRSSHCRYCCSCVVQKDHHCFWIDTCIGARNHPTFLLGLLFLVCANYYGAMLTLTTVCQPILLLDFFLIPTDCSGVYDDIHLSVCFVSAIYAVLIAAVAFWSLLKQLYLVSINLTMEEWQRSRTLYNPSVEKSHSKGIFNNWYLFLRGQR